MTKKNKIWLAAGGAVALAAAAAGLAASSHDHPGRGGLADVNRDGQVTSAEIDQSARQAFTAYDVNNDGRLEGAELALMTEHSGGRHGRRGGQGRELSPEASSAQAGASSPAAAAEAQPPLLRNDFDGDGAVSLAEFRRGLATRYIVLDTNRDGTVSAEEFDAAPRGHRGGRGH